MVTITSRDIEDIISKLSSDKAKSREEGVKLLSTWLDAIEFIKFLGANTAKLKPNAIPHSETWPFLIQLLIRCISLEISACKKRPPKIVFAKTLRTVIQRAEDVKYSGNLPLLSVVKTVFNHVSDALSNVPSFQSEYGIILRHLLAVKCYSFHMRKRNYCCLVLSYIEKVESSLKEKISSQYHQKEEGFRSILTLHLLLENPPGDFPETLREDIVKGFVQIFSFLRDEGKILRKLMECINMFLLKDGINLGGLSLEIHDAVQQVVYRCWLTTHDRGLKEALLLYARLQLNLTRGADDGSILIEQLLDVVCKDLDQSSSPGTLSRSDTTKDDKFGTLSNTQRGLVELAALVFYRACIHTTKAASAEKRARKEPVPGLLKEELMKGKWLWSAAFCYLIHNYYNHISKDLLTYWFEGICSSFERIMNDANMGHTYDGLLWTLRSMQELSSVLLIDSQAENPFRTSFTPNEVDRRWQLIWSCLMHGLPIFSNVTPVVDAALVVLANIISYDTLNSCVVPQDVWDLQLFKQMPSMSILYFIAIYWSQKGSQGDQRDIFHQRKNLLRAALGYFNFKECSVLNECMVLLLPTAVYAICAGCSPLMKYFKNSSISHPYLDVSETGDDWVQMGDHQHRKQLEHFGCFVEVLANKCSSSNFKISASTCQQSSHLPRQLRDPLLQDMENYLYGLLISKDSESWSLSEVLFMCALLSNFVYGSLVTRKKEEISSFLSKASEYFLQLLDLAVCIVQKNQSDLNSLGCLASNSDFSDGSFLLTSFRSLVCSPIFVGWTELDVPDAAFYEAVIQSMERLLRELAKLYESYSNCVGNLQSDLILSEESVLNTPQVSGHFNSNKSRILDMELDVIEEAKNVDTANASGEAIASGLSCSAMKWKLNMILLISSYFSVLHSVTWDILFELLEKECDREVREKILCLLCRHPYWGSSANVTDLVSAVDDMIKLHVNLKLDCVDVLISIHSLLGTLLSLNTAKSENQIGLSSREIDFEQCLINLGDLVNKVADSNLLDWFGRVKLIDCICAFILLDPQIGQTMIGRLLLLLQDPDYRARLFLAQRIGVLFQTWDGHEELFQDICSNFGVVLVMSMKEKLVTASQALAAGPQPRPKIETVVITLMHLALHSEKIELQAVFMICAISAFDPCQRELVNVVIDNLSQQLKYASKWKYLEELLGSILFCWVACGVSLVALVEIRQLFVSDAEPSFFMQYCCHWLLPALVLYGDKSNLNWVAKIAGQPLSILVRSHFVPIFSVSMALHCSAGSNREKGAVVLQQSILELADLSETERDELIKKYMVSIVSHILSLASNASEPAAPFFPRDTVVHAIQTVVDGFLEMEDFSKCAGVIDKINVFRPDRVFMFIVEIHYKIAAAVHHRHKCHRLAGIEVLISCLGHRAAIASTSNYLFNLIGQFIGCQALQDQCCHIISALLKAFKNNPSKEIINVLGEQLQFLVSKLVACCIPSESRDEFSASGSSQVVSLLHQLIVESDPSLHDYIKELEPFPEIDIFDRIRNFQEVTCPAYSARDQLLKFVRRSCYLPSRLISWSFQALHKKLLMIDTFQRESAVVNWHSDREIGQAIWNVVRLCRSDDASCVRAWVSDFISRVGIWDPHCVVFHLPRDSSRIYLPAMRGNASDLNFQLGIGISEELLVALLKVLKKYLMDDSVEIIDMTSKTLRGILSTERGQRAIMSFDSYERSLLEVHSKGINVELVQKFLNDLDKKFKVDVLPLENDAVWETNDKTFEMWICSLVCSLIGYCNDVILRLCQDIVLLKSEVAELLLPSVFVNLAGRQDMDINFCKIISAQVEKHIFTESNKSLKSIQVLLHALNDLRSCHVMEKSSSLPPKRETTKYAKPSSYSSKSRSSSVKSRDVTNSLTTIAASTSSWNKVYWLPIDYLLVAKAAVNCGSYFTAVMYVEHWCEEHFNSLTIGSPDFSHLETIPSHIEILVSAVTQINEPDSLYGIIQSHKLSTQIVILEHEGNWSKALEYYELQLGSSAMVQMGGSSRALSGHMSTFENEMKMRKPCRGLVRSLQQIGCVHVLDMYCQGLTSRNGQFQHDVEFIELQYEAAWRAGNWDFSLLCGDNISPLDQPIKSDNFNKNLHSCLRALQEGDPDEFHSKLEGSKQELVLSVSRASEESTEHIYSSIIKLQILYHLGVAWDIRWKPTSERRSVFLDKQKMVTEPVIPTMNQLSWLNMDWNSILARSQLHMNLLEPFIAFRRVLLQILGCQNSSMQHLLQSASTLRKGSRFSPAAAALHELKFLSAGSGEEESTLYWLGRLEEAKLLRAQGQNEMAINLAKYVSENFKFNDEDSEVYRLVGKWLAETRSSNSGTILEKYLKPAVSLAEDQMTTHKKRCQTHFHLAHYADALFRSYEERLASNEWQAAMRLRKYKTVELEALIRRLKSTTKGDKIDYSAKIQELQRQLSLDKEETEKLLDDRDNFLALALEGYKRCLVIADKYDVRVVFRLLSLWFSLSSSQNVVNNMLSTIDEVQSYKFIPLIYQIASRMGSSKDDFQFALVSLVKKMAIDHPYHTIFQLLALANGDRIKDKQRNRNSFVVDMDKKLAAENLLEELSSYHGPIIKQMKQMVDVYIKLAELETRREDTNRRITLPREIRSLKQLELVPVVTATVPVDRTCQYPEGSFPYFRGLADSITIMNGINAPKVVECLGSDGCKYKQLAKSGNDDLRQDAVMEQVFGLVNTFLQNHRDTWKRRLGVRTYKVVPFTPSAGVLEWVDGTLPLGEYLIGSTRNGGAHGRYGIGDWSFLKCREHMSNEKDKPRAFQEVCENFRPVMHYFFLEKFSQPADWFEKRLAYTRSVAASSMVGYIVGLGDRHSMNILIDQATAEVVHIDLGVAFEQGLMLKTPERVPFRLTRDIIDGMGVTGVEGIFRRCCEKTLSVMRTNKEALLTIVEVFIHDPLYKWALSPLKALQRQKEMDDDLVTNLGGSREEYEGNKDAARALMRVKQKLDGYEGGEMKSEHGQVQQLIQDAIDPERLCQLFPGWGAWM